MSVLRKPLTYGSVCSGIEAATVAWQGLGWRLSFLSEIDDYACRVLAHHYGSNMPGEPYSQNGIPNFGDMTKYEQWPDKSIDLLVGGTPCQSFSIAGLRKGLDDPRGNLMLTYLAIARKYRPRWLVWENVPGVLSSNGGRDFATFLTALGECGYSCAYRVLDAQYVRVDGFPRAVPQRRRRVFVVGYLGDDWRPPAAVLFDEPTDVINKRKIHKTKRDCSNRIANENRGTIIETYTKAGFHSHIKSNVASTLCARKREEIRDIVYTKNNSTGEYVIRRLTPIECERLQGFPDNYTKINEKTANSHRYKALGNSMAVNVMRWIGTRIQMVDNILKEKAA